MKKNQHLHVKWFEGLDDNEKADLEKILQEPNFLLDKLREIVYNISISNNKITLDDYDCPSWSHKQADKNGFDRACRLILSILPKTD